MFTSAEKTLKPSQLSRKQGSEGTFFRKGGADFASIEHEAETPFFKPAIQPKLSVSSPNDPQEHEADAVADKVMRMPDPAPAGVQKEEEKIQKKEDDKTRVPQPELITPIVTINRKCEHCEKEDKEGAQLKRKVQRMPEIQDGGEEKIRQKPNNSAHIMLSDERGPPRSASHTSFEQQLALSKGRGSAMSSNTQQFMEGRFGTGFTAVRIHTGDYAQLLSASINAQAFTHGNDIYFNTGKYSPGTAEGGNLLAHELTHTLQQGGAFVQRKSANNKTIANNHVKKSQPLISSVSNKHALKNTKFIANNAGVAKATKDEAKQAKQNLIDFPGEKKAGPPAIKNTGLTILMPEAQSTLNEPSKKRVENAQQNAAKAATANSNLPASDENVTDARNSVKEPTAESNAKAGQDLMEQLGKKQEPNPEIIALCEKIRKVIREKRPPDEGSLVDAKPEEDAKKAGQQVDENINNDVNNVEKNYDEIKQTPQGAAATNSKDVQAPPESVDAPAINAPAAVPDAIKAENLSLDKDVKAADERIKESGMESDTAKLVQDGPIAEARNANEALKETAASDPTIAAAAQKATLAKAGEDMALLQAQALQTLKNSRKQTIGGVGNSQVKMKETEEQKRERVAKESQEIFNKTQTQINDLLKPLSKNAMIKYEAGVDVASQKFKAILKKVKDWIDERHEGVGGALLSLKDSVVGLPDWVTEEYNKAEKAFGDDICNLITEISMDVNTVIATCETLIRQAHETITKKFNDAFGELDEWALAQIKSFDKQLNGLQYNVNNTRDELNKDMMNKAAESVQAVREEVNGLREKAKGMIGRIADAIAAFIDDPAKFIIEGLLKLLGIPPPDFWRLVKKINTVIGQIADDPIGFANNLMNSLSKGFTLFTDNFGTHLLKGIVSWLTSGLGTVGVQLPKDFSLSSMISFFLQLMGISWARIRKLLAKHIGEKNVEHLEQAYNIITELAEKGPEGLYEMIKEKLNPQTILDGIFDAIIDFVKVELIKRVGIELLKLFNPAGAILKALEAIYGIFKWIFENAARIFTLVDTVVTGIANIINGNIAGMAKIIEKALAMLIVPIVDFFAEMVGLGDLPKKIANLIKGFQDWIEAKLDIAIGWLAEKAKKFIKKVKDKIFNWWKARKDFTGADGKHHELFFSGDSTNAVLTVKSDPTPFRNFLTAYKKELSEQETINVGSENIPKKKIIEDCEQLGDNIDAERKKQLAKYQGNNDEEKEASKASVIQALINELANKLVPLFGEATQKPTDWLLPKNETSMAFANHQSAQRIWKTDKVIENGSGPTKAKHPIYDDLDIRRKGKGSYYVRGHLINEKIGGPGTWNNMTPLPQAANEEHERKGEGRIKAAFESGAVIHYDVTTNGKQNIKKATLADKNRFTRIKNFESALPYLEKITEAESNVPSQLVFTASTMKKDGNEWKEDKKIANDVINIKLGDYSDYEIGELGGDVQLGIEALRNEADQTTLSFAKFKSQDKVHEHSIAVFSDGSMEMKSLISIFNKKERESLRDMELKRIDGMNGPKDITTWNSFTGSRTFFTENADEAYNSVQKAFSDKQNNLRNAALQAAIVLTTSQNVFSETWQKFKYDQSINFNAPNSAEQKMLDKIQTSFRAKQK